MSIQGFEILSKIGQGAYSIVFKVRRMSDSRIYALKKVSIESLSPKEKENALSEIRIMASIKNPNVISYKESFFDEDEKSLCLIMEFADSGDLFQRIQKCKSRLVRLSENFIWSLLIQITQGLKALHDLGVIHRDLKSANIFLNHDGSAKLGDMNVSKVANDGFLMTQTGTPYYASPEVWNSTQYSLKSDIWSLGCILYEACALKPPFRGRDMESLYEKVSQGKFDPIPRVYSKDLSEVITILLNSNSALRPSCDEILDMEQVRNRIDCKKMVKSGSVLLEAIKVPEDINMISMCLPQPDYEEGTGKYVGNGKILPRLKMQVRRSRLDMHKTIENSTDRLRRIKDIYLSPRNLYLSPQAKKNKLFL